MNKLKKVIDILKNKSVLLGIAWGASLVLVGWFFSHYFIQSPIVIIFRPMVVRRDSTTPQVKRVPALPTVLPPKPTVSTEKVSTDPVKAQNDPSDSEIAKYIKSKGWDYSIAIRLAKSENFYNLTHSFVCSRTHTNKDGSIDVGIFQVNSIHRSTLLKMGMTMKDMEDCYKNIDFAYSWIFKGSGWEAWSAYNNGSYLTHSEEI